MTWKSSSSVFVLLYNHRYGQDVSLYSSEDLAVKSVFSIIKENLQDFEDNCTDSNRDQKVSELNQAIATSNLSVAMNLWADIMEEYFDIDNFPVWDGE